MMRNIQLHLEGIGPSGEVSQYTLTSWTPERTIAGETGCKSSYKAGSMTLPLFSSWVHA